MDSIYIFETRELDYLNSYIAKAKQLGYDPVVISEKDLVDNERFEAFKADYQHLSINAFDFEFNCFARYFALEKALRTDGPFIFSDSDIYLTNRKINLQDNAFKNVFVGSEGFINSRTVRDISPHFSIWNRQLLTSFVDHLLASYKRNKEDQFLVRYGAEQKERLGFMAISDMTLLYLWVHDHHIPFINSNSIANSWGIDHNISALEYQEGRYRSEYARKKVKISASGDVYCILENGDREAMACLHLQGGYKKGLQMLYTSNYKAFQEFSIKHNIGQKAHLLAAGKKHKPFRPLARETVAIEAALDTYRAELDRIPDNEFGLTPPGGGWSYAEVYSHILQATIGSSVATERCTNPANKPTSKGTTLLGKAMLFFGRFPPLKVKVPTDVAAAIPATKISKEEARNLLIKCRARIAKVAPLLNDAPADRRFVHARFGMMNSKQWFKFIRIHLQHHLKQIRRLEKIFSL